MNQFPWCSTFLEVFWSSPTIGRSSNFLQSLLVCFRREIPSVSISGDSEALLDLFSWVHMLHSVPLVVNFLSCMPSLDFQSKIKWWQFPWGGDVSIQWFWPGPQNQTTFLYMFTSLVKGLLSVSLGTDNGMGVSVSDLYRVLEVPMGQLELQQEKQWLMGRLPDESMMQ